MASKTFFIAFYILLFNVNHSLYAQMQKPNFVFIVVDDMRFDECSGGGHQTPAPLSDSVAVYESETGYFIAYPMR